MLTDDGQQLGRHHIIWQVVPSPWTDNWESLGVGDGCQLDQMHYQTADCAIALIFCL